MPRHQSVTPSVATPLDVPVTPRNAGMPLELEWVQEVRVNPARSDARLRARRTVKKEWQAAWLLRAVTLMDLTSRRATTSDGSVGSVTGAAPGSHRLPVMHARRLPSRWPLSASTIDSSDRDRALEGSIQWPRFPLVSLPGSHPSSGAWRKSGLRRRRREGDRRRDHPGSCADRELGRSVRRGPGNTGCLRRAHQDHSRQGAGAAECRPASLVCMFGRADT
jgi:hypothetical protein